MKYKMEGNNLGKNNNLDIIRNIVERKMRRRDCENQCQERDQTESRNEISQWRIE